MPQESDGEDTARVLDETDVVGPMQTLVDVSDENRTEGDV